MGQPGDFIEGVSVLAAGWRMLKPPKIVISAPFNPTVETDYCWWHVKVSNVRRWRWVISRPAVRCAVFMTITKPNGKRNRVQGMWATTNGPQQYAALIVDESAAEIPIAFRFPPTINRGGWNPNDDSTPFITYITDAQYLVTVKSTQHYGVPWVWSGNSGLLPGNYHIELEIRSGHKVYAREHYTLRVPNHGLVDFRLLKNQETKS